MSNIEPPDTASVDKNIVGTYVIEVKRISTVVFPTGARIAGTSTRQRSDMQQVWPSSGRPEGDGHPRCRCGRSTWQIRSARYWMRAQLRRELLGPPDHDAAAPLILRIVLDLRARRPM
jgi:hypothetical protein